MSRLETLPFSQSLLLARSEQCLAITSAMPLRVLSSALVGEGFGRVRHFANFHVDKHYDGHSPNEDLAQWLLAQGLPLTSVAMMTAVQLNSACVVSLPLGNLPHGVMALVTAGVGNAVDISVPSQDDPRLALRAAPKVGTINIFAFLDAQLTDGALVNACLSVTEAKVQALRQVGVTDPYSGTPATGTSTDSISIAATQRGDATPYAGSGTSIGRALGQAVYQATLGSLSLSQMRTPTC
ncbi:MAG: adenosylcobinamide amidohydrolase [Halomonas sp.]|nr:adenosylcobinamide amidohydrolase [Halomonas sp.]MDP3536886.1 adenosylcobinamide amidohydrolase [Halomonas sp.]